MARVLIAGASGLLGSSLTPLLRKCGHSVLTMGHSALNDVSVDLTNYQAAHTALESANPEVIVNLVALTNVDACEINPQSAYLLNCKTVENISSWIRAKEHLCHLIHISSDQVYDGEGPHSEESITICNQYAISKYAGELSALTVPSTILRTNFFGRSQCSGRISLTDWLVSSLQNLKHINVFSDVMFSPLSIGSLCHLIEKCICERPLGIYNLGSKSGMSKADFAFLFADALGLSKLFLKRADMRSDESVVAKRPFDMRMSVDLFETRMDVRLPNLADEILSVANDYVHSINS